MVSSLSVGTSLSLRCCDLSTRSITASRLEQFRPAAQLFRTALSRAELLYVNAPGAADRRTNRKPCSGFIAVAGGGDALAAGF